MRIYHNIPALTAYNSLNGTNNAMEKTIQKLSTGLRINSAADDAAGFAISEKMRSQISGLEIAIRNTQDATSMLQTAEGALGETNSMLQRMRELAVQASNDTLTSQDRSYIQLEIDQLADQIDRIAKTTQFNKKRLLDGSSAGITTSSNLSVKAYVNGSLREIDQFGQKKSFEGNYKITVNVDPTQTGTGQVQKSSIMTIKHPNVITDVQAVSDNGIQKVAVDNLPAGDYNLTKQTVTAGGKVTGAYNAGEGDILSAVTVDAPGTVDKNASILFEVVATSDDSVTLKATVNSLTTSGDVENYLEDKIVVSGSNAINLGNRLGFENDDAVAITLSSVNDATVGSKFVFNTVATGGDTGVRLEGTIDANWPEAWDGELIANNGDYTNAGNVEYNLTASDVQNKEVHFRNFYINGNNGTVYDGDVILTTNNKFTNSLNNDDKLASFTAAYIGKPATYDTKLRDLNTFWNSSGVFMLDNPQTITITQGDGKQASVTLYATDTLREVEAKFNQAIGVDLGQGQYVKGAGASEFCSFVNDPDAQGIESVQGTFIFRSVLPGARGDLTFTGDEDLINTLAMNTVKESSTAAFQVSVYDAHSQTPIATNVKVANNRLIGVLHPNVDIEFDPVADIEAEWSEEEKNFILKPKDGAYDAIIHIVDSSTVFQIGANEGEDIAIDIGNMSAGALGVTNINVATRTTAAAAIGQIDAAINKVSTQRAKIGAYQNALEYTSENLTTTMTNLTMLAQANQLPQSVMSLLQ